MKVWKKSYLFTKGLFFIFIMQSLLACSSMNSERIAPSILGAYDSIKGALFGFPDPIINKEILNRIPYASAILKIGKGSSGLIILESIDSYSFVWVSKDNVYLKTKNGRIVQTEGLFNNLTNLTSPSQSFEEVLKSMKNRDQSDMTRTHSMLKKTKDSCLINTTGLTIKDGFLKIKKIMDKKLKEKYGRNL